MVQRDYVFLTSRNGDETRSQIVIWSVVDGRAVHSISSTTLIKYLQKKLRTKIKK